MSTAPLVLEFICIFIVTTLIIYRYGNVKKQHFAVTFIAFLSWYLSFLIVCLLPLDIASTFYSQCLERHKTNRSEELSSVSNTTADDGAYKHLMCKEPSSYIPASVLRTLWRIIYWTSQILTWLVMPIMQSYVRSAHFTLYRKFKSAIIENLIFYGTYLVIFIICFIYVAATYTLDGDKLKVIGITASNTWGLFLLVLLLGYGLVDVPRRMWDNINFQYRLSRVQFKIAKLSTEKSEAEENLEDILEEAKKTAESIRYTNPLRQNMETILEKCPESFRASVKTRDDFEDYKFSNEKVTTEKSLVQLHQRVINYTRACQRMRVQWSMLLKEAFKLEVIINNESNPSHIFIRDQVADNSGYLHRYCQSVYSPTIEWYVECRLKRYLRIGSAIALTVMSFMVIWSECLFSISNPTISLFAIFVSGAKSSNHYWMIELICIVSITFMCWCAYQSVFQVKLMNLYYIAPHHQTDESSLLFIGMMLCRLTPPLCLNYLGLIHLDSHVIKTSVNETSFTWIMGHMDVIPIVSNGFNIYFPIIILLLCVFTYFKLGSRILSFVGIQQFIGDDDFAQDLVNEGKQLLRQEKRRLERMAGQTQNTERKDYSSSFRETLYSHRKKYSQLYTENSDRTKLLDSHDSSVADINEDTEKLYDNLEFNRYSKPTSDKAASKFPTRGIFDDV